MMANNSNRALVFANGEIPSLEVVNILVQNCDFIIACDGGLNHCNRLGIIPNLLCGDLDSTDSDLLDALNSEFTDVIQMQNQDKSDLSKTLSYLKDEGFSSIDVIGIEGGRLDHQFGVWSCLIESDSYASLHYEDFVLRRVPNETIRLQTKLGKIVSLHAIIQCQGVSLKGCKFTLENEPLEIGTRGIHNLAQAEIIEVSKVSGELLVMIER